MVPRKVVEVLSTTLLNTVEDAVAPEELVPLLPKTTSSVGPGTPPMPVPPDQLAAVDQLVSVLPGVQTAVAARAEGVAARPSSRARAQVNAALVSRRGIMRLSPGGADR